MRSLTGKLDRHVPIHKRRLPEAAISVLHRHRSLLKRVRYVNLEHLQGVPKDRDDTEREREAKLGELLSPIMPQLEEIKLGRLPDGNPELSTLLFTKVDRKIIRVFETMLTTTDLVPVFSAGSFPHLQSLQFLVDGGGDISAFSSLLNKNTGSLRRVRLRFSGSWNSKLEVYFVSLVPRLREITSGNPGLKVLHLEWDPSDAPQIQMALLQPSEYDEPVRPSRWAEFPSLLKRSIGLALHQLILCGDPAWHTFFVQMGSTFRNFGEDCFELLWRECRMEDWEPSQIAKWLAKANDVPAAAAVHNPKKLAFLNWTIGKLQSNNVKLLQEPSHSIRGVLLFLLGQKLGCYGADAENVAARPETVKRIKLVCEAYEPGRLLDLLTAYPESGSGGTDACLVALKEVITVDHLRHLNFKSLAAEIRFFKRLFSTGVERLRFLFSQEFLGSNSALEFKSRFNGENYAAHVIRLLLVSQAPPTGLNGSDFAQLAGRLACQKELLVLKGRVETFGKLFPDILDSPECDLLEAIVDEADSILAPLAASNGSFGKQLNISRLWKLVTAVQRRQTGSEQLDSAWILSTMKIMWQLLIQDAHCLVLCRPSTVERIMDHVKLLFVECPAIPEAFTAVPSAYLSGVVERQTWAKALAAGRAAADRAEESREAEACVAT